jgi:predicted ATPase
MWARGYRSLVDLRLSLGDLTVVLGENGTGKTNIYRSLRLLQRGAEGRLSRTLLDEGGMPSAMWAGEPDRRRNAPSPRVVLGITLDELSYEIELGRKAFDAADGFNLDPVVAQETVWFGAARSRRTTLADRSRKTALVTDADGLQHALTAVLDEAEPLLAQLSDPAGLPELHALRERLRRWRFYHSFPTHQTAPTRLPQAGVFTSILADDGSDLAAALRSIQSVDETGALEQAIEDAFPGCRLAVVGDATGWQVSLRQPGMLRPMAAGELSDGTVRYLCLVAALLSPRLAELMVFNEPETSLHPSLLAPLGRLIADRSEATQIVITTHARELAEALVDGGAATQIVLTTSGGATVPAGVPGRFEASF